MAPPTVAVPLAPQSGANWRFPAAAACCTASMVAPASAVMAHLSGSTDARPSSCRVGSSDSFSTVLDLNSRAPDFEAPDQQGDNVRLSDHRGSWVVLWWYPKASTAG